MLRSASQLAEDLAAATDLRWLADHLKASSAVFAADEAYQAELANLIQEMKSGVGHKRWGDAMPPQCSIVLCWCWYSNERLLHLHASLH